MSNSKSVPFAHFERQLAHLVEHLKRDCQDYDNGRFYAATPIASSLALLALDKRDKFGNLKNDGISLLRRMGRYPKKILDRSTQDLISKSHLHGPICAVGYGRQSSIGFFPILDGFPEFAGQPPRFVPADAWWDASILRDRYGNLFKRCELLTTFRDRIANHSDERWPEEYVGLSFEDSMTTKVSGPIAAYGDVDTLRVAIRQMAHEVLRTIDPNHKATFTSVPACECLPVVLVEIQEEVTAGNWIVTTDPRAIEAHMHVTSCEGVAVKWRSEEQTPSATPPGRYSDAPGLASESPCDKTGHADGERRRRMRFHFANPAPSTCAVGMAQFSFPSAAPTYEYDSESSP